MSPFALLVYFPLWAITVAVGFTALRLSRRREHGLVALCFAQAVWVSALALLESGQVDWAERVVPSGMLLAGANVQIAHELAGRVRRGLVLATWGFGAVVALLGAIAPRLFYGPGAVGPGPLFFPLGLLSMAGTLLVYWDLLRLVRSAPDRRARQRRAMLLVANVLEALGGGVAISLHVLGLAPLWLVTPFFLPAVLLAAHAVWSAELGRSRDLLLQGFVHALVTALLSCAALVLFAAWLPALVPGGELRSSWALLAAFCVALALEPMRQWVVELILGKLFREPIAVRSLVGSAEEARGKAEHAERLAEVGLLASAVAHEVRNPLGVVLAETKLLERAGADAESVATLRAQVARANRFVDDLLAWSKPRPLEPRAVDGGVVARRAAELAARAVSGAATPVVEVAARDASLEADEPALEDVLVNLLTNALIAVDGQGTVRVRVEERGAELAFVVEDDGAGVPPALEPRLFQVFATGRGRDARHPGTGLGLATAARLVARHGGSLRHERPAAGGARFIASLPRQARIGV